MAQVRIVDVQEVAVRLEELEAKYDMPMTHFVEAFRDGRLDESSDFRLWSRLRRTRRRDH